MTILMGKTVNCVECGKQFFDSELGEHGFRRIGKEVYCDDCVVKRIEEIPWRRREE